MFREIFIVYIIVGALYVWSCKSEGTVPSFKGYHSWVFEIFKENIFSKPVNRWVMDPILEHQFLELVKPYADFHLIHNCWQDMNDAVPCIYIQFHQRPNTSETELLDLEELLIYHFRNYFNYREIDWKSFISFYKLGSEVTYILYYAETNDDVENLKKRYEIYVKERSSKNVEPNFDDRLERLLKRMGENNNEQ